MIQEPVLVLFCGGMGGSPVEDGLADALRECALDTLEEARATGAYAAYVLVLDEASARYFEGRLPADVDLDIDRPGEPFHFGHCLRDVILSRGLQRPVYIGCGLPLIKGDELLAIATGLNSAERAVVSNNFYSADLLGIVPGDVVRDLELPNNDRILPRLLCDTAGLANLALPRTMANQFDIDTPGDLAMLAYAGGAGRNLQRYLDQHPPDTSRLAAASRLFTNRNAEVLVTGRVGSQVWQYLESETACRIRMYSEERGMQAAGRDSNGQARSLLAYHLQSVGTQHFFEELGTMADAAFIDTRPIFAHLSLEPSRPDRFLSDAMTPEGISDPWLREFTAAALAAPIPVVIGGASLVASGVQLICEAAWAENDKRTEAYRPMGRAATPPGSGT
jgi:hypothetical protein